MGRSRLVPTDTFLDPIVGSRVRVGLEAGVQSEWDGRDFFTHLSNHLSTRNRIYLFVYLVGEHSQA